MFESTPSAAFNFEWRGDAKVRVEPAFQSTDPFGEHYIEAPDAAFAPPATGWNRQDTSFQLLVYYDQPEHAQVIRAASKGWRRFGKGRRMGHGGWA